MTDKKLPDDSDIEVSNPRYAGATPEMVARALLKRPTKEGKASVEEPESS